MARNVAGAPMAATTAPPIRIPRGISRPGSGSDGAEGAAPQVRRDDLGHDGEEQRIDRPGGDARHRERSDGERE